MSANLLIFLAGSAAGMAFCFICIVLGIALSRKLTEEQRKNNADVKHLLTVANTYRQYSYDALKRIAFVLEDRK